MLFSLLFESLYCGLFKSRTVVKNVYEDDKVEAIIPIEEVYELMRDWRDFQREYYHNHTSS